MKSDDPATGRLQALLQRLQPGSLFPMDVIAPAARLFAEAQAPEPREVDLGMTRTANAEGRSNGASVPIKFTTRIDKDARRRLRHLLLVQGLRPRGADGGLAGGHRSRDQGARGQEPRNLRRKARGIFPRQPDGHDDGALSLDDGSAIYAEEIVDNRIGPAFTKNVLRATRQ